MTSAVKAVKFSAKLVGDPATQAATGAADAGATAV